MLKARVQELMRMAGTLGIPTLGRNATGEPGGWELEIIGSGERYINAPEADRAIFMHKRTVSPRIRRSARSLAWGIRAGVIRVFSRVKR